MNQVYYFAYGSNLHPLRLRQRVPSCQAIGVATLSHHQLRWHKRGRDGSGKCDAFFTGQPGDLLTGVVYSLLVNEKALLDRAEGLGQGYRLARAVVQVNEQPLDTFFYQAETAHVDADLLPYDWYQQLVFVGAQLHSLPAAYIRQIAAVITTQDDDQIRRDLHREIIHQYASGSGVCALS